MILICDYCGHVQNQIFKIPSKSYYVEDNSLIVLNEPNYMNLCLKCIGSEMERSEQ